MKILIALGTVLSLVAHSVQADPLADAQAAARDARLADDPAWADLLQYEPYPITGHLRSRLQDPARTARDR